MDSNYGLQNFNPLAPDGSTLINKLYTKTINTMTTLKGKTGRQAAGLLVRKALRGARAASGQAGSGCVLLTGANSRPGRPGVPSSGST